MTKAFNDASFRLIDPKVVLFPSTINLFITPFERQLVDNAKNIRGLFEKIVEERRAELKTDPEAVKAKGDLVSILLTDELFCTDNEMIIDECMTFFLAGSGTQAESTLGLFNHLMKKSEYIEKIRTEIKQVITDPSGDQKASLLDLFNFENIADMNLF